MVFRFQHLAAFRSAAGAAGRNRGITPHLLPLSTAEDRNHSKTSKRWHGGHSHHHLGEGGKVGDGIFKLGLAADIALATGKALTGYISGSTAIAADAVHSMSDIVLSGVALWSFKASRAPKDQDYPYGYGKFESLGALGISCMLLATASGIAWHALDVLHGILTATPDMINHSLTHKHESNHVHGGHHHGIDLNHPVLALSMAITSISVKEGLYRITKRAGDKEGSGLMKANAWHHRADAVSSLVALIGVGGAILGVPFLDPLAGLVVSGMVLKAGVESGYQSVLELVNAGVPLPILAPIKHTILEVKGVKGCRRLRGRKAGSSLYLDAHIEVDPLLNVCAAHEIGENVRDQIQKNHKEVGEIDVHIDPSASNFSAAISDQQKITETTLGENWNCPEKQNFEPIVSNILHPQFPERTSIEHLTRHTSIVKLFLQVQVSVPPDMLIQDAMKIAKEAEREILKAVPRINQVSIQLRLGHPIPQFNRKRVQDI